VADETKLRNSSAARLGLASHQAQRKSSDRTYTASLLISSSVFARSWKTREEEKDCCITSCAVVQLELLHHVNEF